MKQDNHSKKGRCLIQKIKLIYVLYVYLMMAVWTAATCSVNIKSTVYGVLLLSVVLFGYL